MKAHEVAFTYIGQTEKPGNSGFSNMEFEKKMKAVGFQPTHAWCAYFQELCFKEAYPEKNQELDKLFSASAVQTFKNFKDAGYGINELPREGNLVIWRHFKNGKPEWTGHAGVVYKVIDKDTFECIEGNTNDVGGREGYIVAKRVRKVVRKINDGLAIMGFVEI